MHLENYVILIVTCLARLWYLVRSVNRLSFCYHNALPVCPYQVDSLVNNIIKIYQWINLFGIYYLICPLSQD